MDWQFSIYLLFLLLSTSISFMLGYFTYRNRDKRTAPQILCILLGIGIWAGADTVRIASSDLTIKLLMHNVEFIGSTLLVLAVILFVLEYTNREEYLTRRTVGALALPFVVTVVLVWTEGILDHGLVRQDYQLVSEGGLLLLDPTWGPWFTVNLVYSYALLIVTMILFAVEFYHEDPGTSYRRQLLLLMLAVIVPWVASGLFVAGFSLVDLTSPTLTFTGVIFYTLLFRLELLDLVPVARSTVVDNIEHGFMVLSDDGRIVDVNDSMASIIGLPRASLIGAETATIFRDCPQIAEKLHNSDTREDIPVELDGERRHFDVEISSVYANNDRYVGRVVLVRDVTDDRRRERRLREQTERLKRHNERLDQFARILSHDLRNPLNVAQALVQMEKTDRETDTDRLDEIDDSLARMEELIQDVLTLARQTNDAIETEPVELETVATESWQTVGTKDGEIVIDSSATFEADRSRLKRLLENLIRNAFDHGPNDCTVSIGVMPGGFYVEDDGPGIPADERESVFEEGYTNATDGTGLGLSIVSAIAAAHGWSVSVTTGSNGGARFEIFVDSTDP